MTKTQDVYMVFGGEGFIGGHLVRELKKQGKFVVSVDIKRHEFKQDGFADVRIIADLRDISKVYSIIERYKPVELYQLAADMGGAGFVFTGDNDADIMTNSSLINLNTLCAIVACAPECKVFYSSSACFIKGTPVLTKKGIKNIEDIQIGDKVLTHTGNYKTVKKTINNLFSGKMCRLKISGNPEIICTYDHRFLTSKGEWIEAYKLLGHEVQFAIPNESQNIPEKMFWKLPEINEFINETRDINPNQIDCNSYSKKMNLDYHALYNNIWAKNRTSNKFIDPIFKSKIEFDKKFGELCGLYLAEGWVEHSKHGSKRVNFAFGDEPEYIEKTVNLLNDCFGVPTDRCRIIKMKNQKGSKIQICSNILASFFETYFYEDGRRCYHKKIPDFLMNSTNECKLGLIRGFWQGDGSSQIKRGKTRYLFNSTSINLISQIRTLLLEFGIYTSLNIRTPKEKIGTICNRKVNLCKSYQIYNLAETSELMKSIIEQNINYSPDKSILPQIYRPVQSVEIFDYLGSVFNLEVEEDHSFTVFNASTHNCMYPAYNQEDPTNPNCKEDSAYPAAPDSEYGWEKLFSERLYLAFHRNYNIQVRIARFHNIFGPEGTWNGGREKAPAALCRKVAELNNEKLSIDIWGDGKQTRSFLYVDECVEGILRLMASNFIGPVNIGSDEMVTINDLANTIAQIANKNTMTLNHISGPQGVRGRNSDNALIFEKLGWKPTQPLVDGLKKTYLWIEEQVRNSKDEQ